MVVYHVWLGRISGGVDVFFFLTGFLITGQLFRAGLRGRIGFRALWGRMITRLFPAALTVLLVVTAAAAVVLPQARWFPTIREISGTRTLSKMCESVVSHIFDNVRCYGRVADVLGVADRGEPAAGLLLRADPDLGVRPRQAVSTIPAPSLARPVSSTRARPT